MRPKTSIDWEQVRLRLRASEAALAANPQVAKAGTHKPCTPEVLGPALLCLARQTAEALAWSVWLKRAAEAQVPAAGPSGGEHGQS